MDVLVGAARGTLKIVWFLTVLGIGLTLVAVTGAWGWLLVMAATGLLLWLARALLGVVWFRLFRPLLMTVLSPRKESR
jgi:hypothetical protein